MTLRVRRLERADDRSAFRSGSIELDRFFIRFAGQNQFRHHLGTTYVAVDDELILGFATVTASEVTAPLLPLTRRKSLPQYPLPVLRLARLAVHERAQGQGVGRVLLQAVFSLALRMSDDLGCIGIVVDAKREAIRFYEKLGFEGMATIAGVLGERPVPLPMFLPVTMVPQDTGRRPGPTTPPSTPP